MSPLDELEIRGAAKHRGAEHGPSEVDDPGRTIQVRHGDTDPDPGERGGRGGLWLVLGLLLVIAGAAGWYFWPREEPISVADHRSAVPALPTTSAEDLPPVTTSFGELPPLGASDAFVRELVKGISSHPRLAVWVANDALIERFARMVGNIAYDEDPSVHAPFLRPPSGFQVASAGEGSIIDPTSFRRYESLVGALESLDVEGSAAAYRHLRPLIEEAYDELGYPDSFEVSLQRAIAKVLAVPRVEELGVYREVTAYHLVDAELEALAPAQKALLRTGPSNVARLQAKVRRLADAIGAG
jgi:hypothetical protein